MTTSDNKGFLTTHRWRLLGWGSALLLLLAPLIAMQFTREVNWSPADFAVAALIFAAAGSGLELAIRASRSHAYRAASGLALLSAVLLVWINAAVGIIGNAGDPANLLYAGVLAIAAVGALIAGFRPLGMARAMLAAALAQALVASAALALGHSTLIFSAVFVALWLCAAALFGKAARQQAAPRH